MVPVMTPTLVMYQLTPIFHCQECCPPACGRSGDPCLHFPFDVICVLEYAAIEENWVKCTKWCKNVQVLKMLSIAYNWLHLEPERPLTNDLRMNEFWTFPCFLLQNVKDRPWACGSVVCQACVFCCIINVVTRDHACSCLPPVSNTNIANFYQQTDRNHWRLC